MTESYVIEVDNLKCGGCANTVNNTLGKNPDILDVKVDPEDGRVEVRLKEGEDTPIIEWVKRTLAKLGYPEKGTGTGIQKVRSYVSCAVGRLS